MPLTPYYRDETVTLYTGDAADTLAQLPAASADCVVTSPPYWGFRNYGTDGQYGHEPSPDAYVATLCRVFAELARVLTPQGCVWLNLGDAYDRAKNLLGLPWKTAFALQTDGWVLRNAVVWHKPNAMPESVGDRLSCRYEMLFLLTRARRYWFDLDPIREPLTHPDALGRGIVVGGPHWT